MIRWTAPMIAELRRLSATGLSRAEIARALNAAFPARVSRNAVIGKLRRLGIVQAGRFRRQSVGPTATCAEAAALEAALDRVAAPVPGGVPGGLLLTELTRSVCRWPIDDPGAERMAFLRFCGAPSGLAVFCPGHKSLARRRPMAVTPAGAPDGRRKRRVRRHIRR